MSAISAAQQEERLLGTKSMTMVAPVVLVEEPSGAHGEVGFSDRELHDARSAVLRSVRRRLAPSAEDAEDIVQETMLRAWKARGRFDRSRALAPWLFTIAKNVAYDQAKRRKPLFVYPDATGPGDAAYERSGWDRIGADSSLGPDLEVIRRDLQDGIETAAAQMTPRYRRLLSLRTVDELSYVEIAECEGITAAAVKPSLSRARSRFVELYAATGAATRLAAWIAGILAGARRLVPRVARAGGAASGTSTSTASGVVATACCVTVAIAGITAGTLIDTTLNGHGPTRSGSMTEPEAPEQDDEHDPQDPETRGPIASTETNDPVSDSPIAPDPDRSGPLAPGLGVADADVEGDEERIVITNFEPDPTSHASPEDETSTEDSGGEATLECVEPDGGSVSCEAISIIGPMIPS